jgi:hypothetical protein
MQNACRWPGGLPPAMSPRPRWKPHAAVACRSRRAGSALSWGPDQASDTLGGDGNTQAMTGVPAATLYHRWLGWHAPAMRRALAVLIAGLIVAVVLLPFVTWGPALVGGGTPRRSPSSWPPGRFLSEPTAHVPRSSRPEKTRRRARRGYCWSGPAWPASRGRLRAAPGGAGGRRAAAAAGRRRRADRRALVDGGQHALHAALRRPALPVQARGHCVRLRRRAGRARLPRLCLRRLHHRHVLPGARHDAAIPGSGAPGSPARSCPTCLAWSSWQVRSTSSPGCSASSAPSLVPPAERSPCHLHRFCPAPAYRCWLPTKGGPADGHPFQRHPASRRTRRHGVRRDHRLSPLSGLQPGADPRDGHQQDDTGAEFVADRKKRIGKRVRAYAQAAYGQHSQVGKILELHQELPGRIHIVLIRQQVGF